MQLAFDFPEPTASDRSPREWEARAVECARRCLTAARARWPKAALPEPVIRFDLKGLAAGEACPSDWTLRFHRELLLRHGDAFVDTIVPHEVAHLVVTAAWKGRRRPHGAEWKEVMAFFGVPAERCHRFEVEPSRRMRRFAYRCACRNPHYLTKRAHLRIRRGTAEYSCRECREILVRVEG